MKKILLLLLATVQLLSAQTASVQIDANGNVLNFSTSPKTVNFPTGKLTVNGVQISGLISDGDKGDITVSGSGATWTIDAKTISLAKMADMATASFLGRNTAGTSSPEVLSISTVKTMLGIAGTFGTAAYVNTGTTSGTVPLLGTGGHLANATMPLGAQLYDNAGTPVLAADFGARQFKAFNGTTVIDFNGGPAIYDDSGFLTADLGSERYLYASDGTTIVLNWADPTQLLLGASAVVYANGNIDANSINAQLWDGTNVSVSAADRQLIANDGSTVALDWSDPTSVAFFTDAIVMGNDGNLSANAVSASTFTGDGSALSNVTPKVGSIGSVIAGTKTATGTATTTFTVTIGVTMANTAYKVTTEGDNALSAAVHYVNNKTTTSFDIVYLAGLSGPVSIDWIVSP